MPEPERSQLLLDLALSMAGEADPGRLLSRTLPLLVARTDSEAAGVVHLRSDGPELVYVTDGAEPRTPSWQQVAQAVALAPRDGDDTALQVAGARYQVLDLPGYGRLLLRRHTALDPALTAALRPLLDVLARPLVAAFEEHRRRAAELRLASLGTRQRGLLDALPFAVWLTDRDGRYVEVNQAFLDWVGRERREIVGQLPDTVLPARLAATAGSTDARVLAAGEVARERHQDPASGAEHELERTPYRDAQGRVQGLIGMRRDVTEQAEALRLVDERARFQRLLMQLAVGFVNTPLDELDDAIDAALAETGSFAGVDRAYVFAYDLVAGSVTNTHEWCADGIEPQIDNLQLTPLAQVQDWLLTHLRGELVHIQDVGALPPDSGVRQVLEPQGIVTLIALPIAAQDELFGFVGFDAVRGARYWTEDELRLLQVLAELLANAELRRRYEAELVAARRQEQVARSRFELALQAVTDAVWEWDAQTDHVFHSAALPRQVGSSGAAGSVPSAAVLALLEPTSREQLERVATAAITGGDEAFAAEVELMHRAGGTVPVRLQAVIVRDEAGRPARIAGLSVDLTRERREQQLQQRRLEMEAVLARISARFVGFEAFGTGVQAALADLGQAYGASRAYLALLDAARTRIRNPYEWCAPGVASVRGRFDGIPVEVLDVALDRLGAGQPVLVTDAADLGPEREAEAALLAEHGVRSLVALPLLVGGRLEGMIGIDQTERTGAWSEEDVALLRAAAEVVAGALARSRAEEDLVAAREQAEVANQAKTRFVSTLSHELRTPMTGVLGMIELLSRSELDARQRRDAERAHAAARGLLRLLDDLLDIARIEQRRLTLQPQVVALRPLLEGVVDTVRFEAEARGLHLSLVVDPQLPERVEADPDRIRQILTNLLANAIRFTDAGTVRLDAQCTRAGCRPDPDGQGLGVRLEVADTGIGIDPADQLTVFDPFVQVDPSSTRRAGGTGLGLSIVRELVGLMGGTVRLDSRPGAGTTVTVDLPLPVIAPETAVSRTDGAEPTVPAGTTILVAEDNPINQAVLEGFLADLPCELTMVGDGAAAVDAALAERFDLVLMDCFMPGTDGLEATRRIRAQVGRALPIVAVTADASDEHRRACLTAGMDAVLTKPFERSELLRTLVELLPASHRPGAGPEGAVVATHRQAHPVGRVAGAHDPSPALDPTVLEGLAARRTPAGAALPALLALFRANAPGHVAELAAAADAPDPARYRLAAQTLGAHAATLGLQRLRRRCEQAEQVAQAALEAPDHEPDVEVLRDLAAVVADEHVAALGALEDRCGDRGGDQGGG